MNTLICKIVKPTICLTALLLLGACSSITKQVITLKPEPASVFTHPSLSKFLAQNPGAAVVVRDPNATMGGVSTSGKTSELCGIMERALMKRGYNPRDRRLFESVVEKMNDIDYVKLGEQTRTDLIFEITNFTEEEYIVRNYEEYKNVYLPILIPIYLKRDALTQKKLKEPRTLRGYSIEIKVVLLQDNLIGGTYKYFYTPCSLFDCDFSYEITIDDISRKNSLYKAYSKGYIKFLEETVKNETLSQEERDEALELRNKLKEMKKAERKTFYIEDLEKTLEKQFQPMSLNEFVSDIVVPSLFKDMGGDTAE
jgi:hypothetical protein